MIVWTIRGKISELFCAVFCTIVVHSDMHTHMSSSYNCCWFRFSVAVGLLFVFFPFCSCTVCFCCVRFSFFSTKPRLAGKNVYEMTYSLSSGT